MASRVRIATATCLVASGLLVGGAGGALAFADPALDGGDAVTGQTEGDPPGPDAARDVQDAAGSEEKPDTGTVGEPKVDPRGDDKRDGGGGPPDDEGDDGHFGSEHDDADTADTADTPDSEDDEPIPTVTETPEPTETEAPLTETPAPQLGECEKKSDDDCAPGGWWPWWPWPTPRPRPPVDAPGTGGGGGVAGQPPAGLPDLRPPEMQIPPGLRPPIDPVEPPEPLNAVPGAGVPAPGLTGPITLPVIAAPPAGLAGGSAAGATAPLPRAPRVVEAEPPAGRQPPQAGALSNASGQATSYRAGYTDYLRSAGLSQLVALAAPGLTGILVLTGAGGLLGYRQAKAGHAVRAGAVARFVN
ncbi:hypothetical protein ABGB19_16650 [Mycobacterium sp. B14F4]|uniref:hypothetical protein n=1 Tax=Mycobacterium sp. B14F4 TaxID=3153565 RepID=UPI00325F10FC